MEIPENLKERFTAMGSKLKIGGAEVGRKVSAQMTVVGGRVKELFQPPSPSERMIEEATAANLRSPDWGRFMEICDMLGDGRVSGQDVARGIKKRIANKNAGVQLLALALLEACVKNHEKMFSEIASERILDDMVRMAEDPQAWPRCRDKALAMIEAWGEATEELGYLPVYEETYKSMRARGVRFPGRDPSSLSPIFTPKSSPSAPSLPDSASGFSGASVINMGRLSDSATLDVAKNSVEVLSNVLTSSNQHQDVSKDELTMSLVEQCKQAQRRVQQVAQRAGEGDPILFQALAVNDELDQVLEKFSELCVSSSSSQQSKPAEPALVTAFVQEDQSYDPLSDLDEEEEVAKAHRKEPNDHIYNRR